MILNKDFENLVSKYGEEFLEIPQMFQKGKTLREIGKIFGVSRQRVHQWKVKYFFGITTSLVNPPDGFYTTSQLIRIWGKKDKKSFLQFLKKRNIKPIDKWKGGVFLWGEDAYLLINSFLNRHCPYCGKSLPPLSRTNKIYCSRKCQETYNKKKKG